ncbi:hypothetical protein JVU11DRAFT_6699 [Chiua virens]|nr:hypothetical protein JVU11DRAFT_6699 [Chiua virens]
MLVPSNLFARDSHDASPLGCQPLSFSSSVCVGDLIAIIACSIAGLGFIFWSVHAIRKIRNDPLDDLVEEDPNHGVDPSTFDHSILAQQGVAQTPSYPDRVRTRLALSQPEEDYYRFTNPVCIDVYTGQAPMKTLDTPRRPPPAGGQPKMTYSHRTGRHGSLVRGGYERYDRMYGNTSRSDSPPQARGSPPRHGGAH